jgi:hypothetical protein
VSSRWSYGPEGLRERPATRWSDADLLPRWRELQPILIRSAGVVGIVATVMAVVSSDGLRFGGGIPLIGRNDRAGDASSESIGPAPIIAAASELNGEGSRQPVTPAPTRVAAVETLDPSAPGAVTPPPPITPPAVATTTSSAASAVHDLRTEKAPEPAPVALASLRPAAQAKAEPDSAPAPAASPLAELRTNKMQPSPDSSAPLTTASVSARGNVSDNQPFSATFVAPATISAASPAVSVAADTNDGRSLIWPDGAATCPRDWVGDAAKAASATDCAPTIELIASIADGDQSALEEAAAMRAESLAALAPRIPLPRPDVMPVVKRVRVSRASSNWPAAPPPNCGAGKHAKWRFTDHKAGSKEWYCR